jgi:hypothetical protein
VSVETDLRALLISHAPLTAVVPASRVRVDAMEQEMARPFIVFSRQGSAPIFGLGNALLGATDTIDIQIVGSTRSNAIAVRDLVQAALIASGQPWSATSSGYDEANDIEAEVVTVEWLT